MTGKATSIIRAAGSPSPGRWVLLLRGINVNPSTRVAMAQLRSLLEGLGFEDVTTILQSGNVVLASPERPDARPIESAIASTTGVRSRVVVLSVAELREIASANPLLHDPTVQHDLDLSKLVITFVGEDIVPEAVLRPSDDELDPERLVVTARAIYQWCPAGILQSQLKPAWWRQIRPVTTARNVRTVNRILETASV
jgi:uncharacterized protein (DUF1697 family)